MLSDTLGQFSATVLGNGSMVHINDAMRDPHGPPVTYCYACVVTLDGTTYTSQDPDIVNDPGMGNNPPVKKTGAKTGTKKKPAKSARAGKKRL